MTIGDWVALIGLGAAMLGAQWAILRSSIINEVKLMISDAVYKMKDDRIRELTDRLEDEHRKNEYLKDKIKDLK